jgi:hypothetical protein
MEQVYPPGLYDYNGGSAAIWKPGELVLEVNHDGTQWRHVKVKEDTNLKPWSRLTKATFTLGTGPNHWTKRHVTPDDPHADTDF